MTHPRLSLSFVALVALVALPRVAVANPRPLPFTYTAQTLPEGEVELEQYVDMTPVKALEIPSGEVAPILATALQTEFEYGITDKLELGLYASFAPKPGSFAGVPDLLWKNGLKQRLRYRLADPGEWPVDIAVYGEVAEMQEEIEVEGKVILERRFGDLRIATNLWAEREFHLDKPEQAWVLNPTLGMTYQVTPVVHPGLEGWMRVEFEDEEEEEAGKPEPPREFNAGPHAYVGPTMLLSFGQFWWSTGVYVRATDFGRSATVGDAYGAIWARTIIGVGL